MGEERIETGRSNDSGAPEPTAGRVFDVAVLGGGISGLTAGLHLSRAGLRVAVLERSHDPGGSIRTWTHEGFLFELGPNTVLDNTPRIGELCEELGVLDERVEADSRAKKRFVVHRGKLVPLPSGPPGFLKTPIFSWRAKLRLLREPFIRRAPDDDEESIARFVRRRLGPEILDYAISPFVSGVYAGDPEKLSVRHATAKIWALERDHGSLIRGAIKKRKGPQPRGKIFSFAGGLATLPQAIARELGDAWTPGASATSVERAGVGAPDGGGYRVSFERDGGLHALTARQVVCALPAEAAARVLAPLGGGPLEAIDGLPYADVAVVSLGFRRADVEHALDGFGFLAPAVEKRYVLGCLFPSTLFAGRSPNDAVALSAFTGGACHPERVAASEDEILDATLRDLRDLLGVRGDPVIRRVERWRPAIPQYVVGHGTRKEAAEAFENAQPGVWLSGNLLHGVSVADCIRNASELAESIVASLRSTARER